MAPFLISGAIALAKEFLPSMVGKIAGDKSGKVAGKVVDMAAELTGFPIPRDQADLEGIIDTFTMDPALATQFQTRMAELEVEETKAYLEDVGNARQRDTELAKAGKTNYRADAMVIAAFIALVIVAVFLIMAEEVDPAVLAFLTTIGGMLMKNISSAFDFEFGSSRGSKGKSDDMGRLMEMLSKK